jgi:chromosome segregation ATPase
MCRNSFGWALLLALLVSLPLPAQSSDSLPTSQAALSAELRQMQTRLNEYASELRRLQESSAIRLTNMSERLQTLSQKLDEASESQASLRRSFARLVSKLNSSERELQDSRTTTLRLQSQSEELKQSLNDLEKSLRQLRRRLWIERIVLTLAGLGLGYGAAEMVDAIGD